MASAALAQKAALIAPSAQWPVSGLRVQLGASIATVKSAYAIDADPVPMSSSSPDVLQLRHEAEGLWFFFYRGACLGNIRLDPPFDGTVAGVRVGDTADRLDLLLGKSQRKPWSFGRDTVHSFQLSQVLTARFDVAPDKAIVRIYLLPAHDGQGATICREIS